MRYEQDSQEFEIKCPSCSTKIFFTSKDIKFIGFLDTFSSDECDGKIICPVCGKKLYVKDGRLYGWHG